MRVAIVGNFSLTGKQTMAVRALPLAERLAARGHAVLMAMPLRSMDARSGQPPVRDVAAVFAGRWPHFPGLVHLWQVLRILLACLKWRPDAVYGFKPIAHSGAIIWAFLLLRRIGVYRGALAVDTDDWEGAGGWNEVQPFPGWLKMFVSLQERSVLAGADVVTAASRTLAVLAKQAGARSILFVPNAVSDRSPCLSQSSSLDVSASLQLRGRPVVLLYTRFFEFQVSRVLRTLEAIRASVPDVALLVVGKGLRGEELELQREAVELGLGTAVTYAGWVSAAELPCYFEAADAAIYPMDDTLLNRAKCPAKLLDLLAAGVPVVADAVGQACEYVEDGVSGLLVNPADEGAMAASVTGLLGDPARRRELSSGAALRARTLFTWDRWAGEVERGLESAVAERPARRRTE